MNHIDVKKIKETGDYIRYLSLFGVEMAKSGHPGLPLGCADIGAALFRYILKYDPQNRLWINRDRFILSAGHGSMLLYSLLHCTGYPYALTDLAKFRSLGSITPGHPEYDPKLGVETTTGPLGQGFANSVGLALEGKMLAARYKGFDYTVYTLMGDGCQMEGVSYEAASVAGHLGLDNLVAIYDSNSITIDGSTDITFSEDVEARYKAAGWHAESCSGEDLAGILTKLDNFKMLTGKPKILIVKTVIGSGLNKLRGSNKAHGAPAGAAEIVHFIQNSTVRHMFEEKFGKDLVQSPEQLQAKISEYLAKREYPIQSNNAAAFFSEGQAENSKSINNWETNYNKDGELTQALAFKMPQTLIEKLLNYTEEKADATRSTSGKILNLCAQEIPQLVGGSADLVESTKATIQGSAYVRKGDFTGRNIAFGVREHAMGSIGNGLALSRQFIPFTSTFFTFFDYMKPPVRLSSIMKLKHLFIYTHDSIAVGEDGPTHEPIEHLNSLRLIPGMRVFRPANAAETAFSYLYFLSEMDSPAAILCTRQNVSEKAFKGPEMDRNALYADFKKGGYKFYETAGKKKPDVILGASGSEVGLAVEAAEILEKEGKAVKVISIPSADLFDEAEAGYRNSLIGDGKTPFVMIEAASYRGMHYLKGKNNFLISLEEFGHSAPGNKVFEALGLTPAKVAEKIKAFIG